MPDSQLAQGTYEVLRNRLREGAADLRGRLGKLHEERSAVFGNLETKLLSTIHVTTEHNCVPRDLFAFQDLILLGSNVQFGLKTEIAASDIFSIYRFDGQHATSTSLGPFDDNRFHRDFAELVRYYKNASFLRFWLNGPNLYMVFQTGKTIASFKAFKWAIEKDAIHYVDNRSEGEIRPIPQTSFPWKRTTRENHRPGKHPHISIEDKLFVECIHGDLTIKIEDSTEDGLGIYREPVDSPDQTLDDAETLYAILDDLILLKIRPYQEKDYRHFVFSVKRSEAKRMDGIGNACILLPDDHGIIMPNGFVLQSGDYKVIEHGLSSLAYDGLRRSPNGEDFLYVFTHAESGTYLQLRYNLIRQTVDTPLVCHGQAFLADGLMLSMRADEQAQKHHAIQVWQTPFTSPDYRPMVQTDSLLFKIGNQDLVRGMSECQEILNLIDRDDSYLGLYSDLVKRATETLDTYFWLDNPEAGELAKPIRLIREAAESAVNEFDKVVRVRQQSEKALADAQHEASELIKKVDRQKFDQIEQFVEGLASVRAQRGNVVQLKELRYIDLAAVEALEKELIEFTERLGSRCVQHLLHPESLKVYQTRIGEFREHGTQARSAAEGRKVEASFQTVGGSLELLIETVSQLKIEDTTQRTEIVDRIANVLAELNRERSLLRAQLREVIHRELESDYASQSKLLDQSMAGALESADEPDKVDTALTRLLVQVEELEGRYAESDDLLLRLTEKRQVIADAFEARRVQLVEARTQRANSLVLAADRLLAGIAAKANRIEEPNALRAYFASDMMVEKVRGITEQLQKLGDSVRQDDVLSRLKSIGDDALRQQRDRRELLTDGNRVIKLGQHAFSVNHQAIELTTVARGGCLQLHITGTQYFEPLDAPELEQAKDLWEVAFPSETPEVYRGETLAYWMSTRVDAERFLASSQEFRIQTIRDFMQTRYQDGYARGVHDQDAERILTELLRTQQNLGLLTTSPKTRAFAMLVWSVLVPTKEREATQQWVIASESIDKLVGVNQPSTAVRAHVRQLMESHGREIAESDSTLDDRTLDNAANFLVDTMRHPSGAFPESPESAAFHKAMLSNLDEKRLVLLQQSLESEALGWSERWGLANRLAVGFWESRQAELSGAGIDKAYAPEVAWRLLAAVQPVVSTAKGTSKSSASPMAKGDSTGVQGQWAKPVKIAGLIGDHPKLQGGELVFQYHDFASRLERHITEIVPRWEALQRTKHELVLRADKRLKTHDLKARVLTSFVRNQLIDTVYLPRIGDNLAKQIGAAGDTKRTDRMGLLLLISPPGYGKTTLMEYIANRLGLVFVKVNGPAIGHGVTSLDPAEAPNAASREEVERINLALEMGDNTMLYLDDIQHCNVELLQKFIPLCDATRRIEGVWKGSSKTYDLRGRKFAVVMAGNPYNESGERFQIPDMLANRADVYNLGEIIGDSQEAFEMSYLENCLTSNPVLQPLSRASNQDQRTLIQAALRGTTDGIDLESNLSVDDVREMTSVLSKLHRIRDVVLTMNREYIRSAAQADDYRTEPPFKLQGSYRNMNRIAEKVVSVMNDDELNRLIVSSYEQDAQTLSRDGESNMLKFKSLLGILNETEGARWADICKAFAQKTKLKGLSGDQATAQVISSILGIQSGLDHIGAAIGSASNLWMEAASQREQKVAPEEGKPPESRVVVQHAVPRVMTELIRSQFQLLYDGLRPVLEEVAQQRQSGERLRQSIADCLRRYEELEAKAKEGPDSIEGEE
ncbi:ATPase involved in DNA repair [Pirellula sp. SH-Sr6A]|uniref:DNA repair ATPase n=1 Tax=Pirellula sp. SH-Sr6A TaxID=1632865 RepID=UPI00078C6D0B|nr:DNA repair ATPase [Pirellula sp. SH-Sr6A]AMV30622.1 ATPase involved in DNA repair [Pirellula sp. SH-Sr6A]